MTPAELSDAVLRAAAEVLASRGADVSLLPVSAPVQRPRNPAHGDYASTLALRLAKKVGVAPRDLALDFARRLRRVEGVRAVEVASPGFLNIRLDDAAAGGLARLVVEQGQRYGRSTALRGQRINLEFVSADPAGPIHIGGVRWAAVGDALARLLRAAGATVVTEYYFNDAGAFGGYFAERELHERGELDSALNRLRQEGHVYDSGGATWLRTTSFGDDKDRVYLRGNGEFSYFAADCAYYLDKRQRGFDKVVIMLGADHHGYLGRMRAMAACFGDDPDQTLEILIGQLVSLLRDGQPFRMSERAGPVISLSDIVEAIGVDAARYALARCSADATIDLDLDLWTRRNSANPVYYVQYAHARIASLLRHAAGIGIGKGDDFNHALLSHDRERDLLKALGDFPVVIARAAGLREPHRLTRYLEDLASAYHRFNDACRVLPHHGEEITDTGRARLWLVDASRIVLANGLRFLGVSAPERM